MHKICESCKHKQADDTVCYYGYYQTNGKDLRGCTCERFAKMLKKISNSKPLVVTIADIMNGCQCAVINLADEVSVVRYVTCPIHGDIEFRKSIELDK